MTIFMKNRGTILPQCSNCNRYKNTETSWIPLHMTSQPFVEFAISKWIDSESLSVTVEAASMLYIFPHGRRFCISVQYADHKDQQRKTALRWFNLSDETCPQCAQFLSMNLEPSIASCVTISNPFGREELVDLFKSELQKTKIAVECVDGEQFMFRNQRSAFRLSNFVKKIMAVRFLEDVNALCNQEYRNAANIPGGLWRCTLEFPAIAKYDLVLLPKRRGEEKILCVCLQAAEILKFADLSSGVTFEMTADEYWEDPFVPLKTDKDAETYYVQSVTPIGLQSGRMQVCSLLLTKDESSGECVTAMSYIGLILQIGDSVRAYDLSRIPDVPETIYVYARADSNKRKW